MIPVVQEGLEVQEDPAVPLVQEVLLIQEVLEGLEGLLIPEGLEGLLIPEGQEDLEAPEVQEDPAVPADLEGWACMASGQNSHMDDIPKADPCRDRRCDCSDVP